MCTFQISGMKILSQKSLEKSWRQIILIEKTYKVRFESPQMIVETNMANQRAELK